MARIVISAIVAVSSIVIGAIMLFTDLLSALYGTNKYIFAIILLSYGIFRLFRLRAQVNASKNRQDEEA